MKAKWLKGRILNTCRLSCPTQAASQWLRREEYYKTHDGKMFLKN